MRTTSFFEPFSPVPYRRHRYVLERKPQIVPYFVVSLVKCVYLQCVHHHTSKSAVIESILSNFLKFVSAVKRHKTFQLFRATKRWTVSEISRMINKAPEIYCRIRETFRRHFSLATVSRGRLQALTMSTNRIAKPNCVFCVLLYFPRKVFPMELLAFVLFSTNHAPEGHRFDALCSIGMDGGLLNFAGKINLSLMWQPSLVAMEELVNRCLDKARGWSWQKK